MSCRCTIRPGNGNIRPIFHVREFQWIFHKLVICCKKSCLKFNMFKMGEAFSKSVRRPFLYLSNLKPCSIACKGKSMHEEFIKAHTALPHAKSLSKQQYYCKFVTSMSLFCNPKPPPSSDQRKWKQARDLKTSMPRPVVTKTPA